MVDLVGSLAGGSFWVRALNEWLVVRCGADSAQYAHLDEEVAHLARENMLAFDAEELKELLKSLEEHAKQVEDPTIVLPFMYGWVARRNWVARVLMRCRHIERQYIDEFPGLHWTFRRVLVPYVFALRHYG